MKNELIHLSLCLELWEAPSDRTSDERGGGGESAGGVNTVAQKCGLACLLLFLECAISKG